MLEIQKRLSCVCHNDNYWRTRDIDINATMRSYENRRQRTPGGNHQNILHEILPTYWEVFHTHNIYQRKKNQLPSRGDDTNHLPCYDIGIFLVGFSTLPIVLSLAEIEPLRQIYFLYSTDTVEMLKQIKDRTSAMLPGSDLSALVDTSADINSDFALQIERPSNPVETFKQIKEIIDTICEDLEPEIKIALDLTGGKKTMIGGGFTAGSILGFGDSIDMFYVDSLAYDSTRGTPKPGTEFLTQLENPYNVYNVQSDGQATELFERHNYEGAASLWETVEVELKVYADQYGLRDEQTRVQRHLEMAKCYRSWDAFDYFDAQEHKNANGNLWNYNDKHVYNNRYDVLDILNEVQNKRTLFEREYRVIHFATDRYQNAVRRANGDKLEDAIVRFTQVVEILCNYKIYQIAQDNNLLDENGYEVRYIGPETQWRNFLLIPFLFGANPPRQRNGNYSFTNNPKYERSGRERNRERYYQFRRDADVCLSLDDYPPFTDIREIMQLIECRNDFVHFNRPIGGEVETIMEKLEKLAYEFLRNFSESYCDYCNRINLSFNDLLKLHEFRPL